MRLERLKLSLRIAWGGDNGSTLRESPKESLEPFTGVGMMLIKFVGMLWFLGDMGLLLAD